MNKEIVKKSENISVAMFKEQLAIAQEYADAIVNSMYGKLFETVVPDMENNLDENGNPTKQKKITKKEDIVSCILLGRELGLTDMVSVSMGKTLDKLAYFQVMKGKALGLDAPSSLQHVYAYEKDGKVVTGIDGQGINAVIIKAGIKYKYIADFKAKKYYRTQVQTGVGIFLGYDLLDDFFILTNSTSPDDLRTAIASKKTIVKEYFTFYTEIEFYRKDWDALRESYSLLDATEAGLYAGYNYNGEFIKGKPAWNGNPKRVLTTRTLSIGGSRIGGDALNGLISLDELNELKNDDNAKPDTTTIDIEHEEVKQ
jgi:hypothetical protein